MRPLGTGFVVLMFLLVGLFFALSGKANPASALVGGTWQTRAALAVEGGAASVIGNKLYVSHGSRPGDSALLSIYDIPTDTWWTGPSASVGRAGLVGAVAGGKHYAIGGRSGSVVLKTVEIFDPATGQWARGPDMPTPRAGLGAAVIGDRIYVVGGRTGPAPHSGAPLGTNEVLNTTTMTWSARQPMPQPVMDVYATAAIGGRVYVFGGYAAGVKNTVQIYDPATDSWTSGAPMPTPRSNAAVGVIGGRAFVIGGVDNGMSNLRVNEVYDPATSSWDRAIAKPTAGSEFAAGAISSPSQLFLVGSGVMGTAMRVHEMFSPSPPPITANPPRLRVDKHIVEPDTARVFLSGTGVPHKAKVKLTVTGIGDPVPVPVRLDIVLALDSSGNMAGNDPQGLRKSGAKGFVDRLDPAKDQVGVVSWDQRFDFSQPLSADFSLVKARIDAVDASGGSDLNAGLNEAIRLLDLGSRPDASKVIIFLGSGEGAYTHATAVTAKDKGFVVYAIGLNQLPGSPGEANLRDIADTTGGRYYFAPTAANLQAIYEAIRFDLSITVAGTGIVVTEVLLRHIQYEGSPSQPPTSITTNPDGTTTIVWNAGFLRIGDIWEVTFLVSSNVAGSSVDVQVTGATGSRVTYDDYTRNSTIVLSPQVKMVVVENGPPVCQAGRDQTIEATHPGPLYAVALDGGSSRDPDGLPGPLTYRWVWGSGSATGATPTVELPLGQTRITLAVHDGAATSQCSVTVTIQNSQPPTVVAQPDVVVEQERREGTPLTLTASVSDAVDPTPRLEWQIGGNTITFPYTFPRGVTRVSAVATDASGNSASDEVVVIVRDTTPPLISIRDVQVPQDPGSPIGARVRLTATVADIVDPNPEVSWSLGPEADFPLGTTLVTVSARDSSGNSSSATLKVTVLANVARTIHVRAWQRPFPGVLVRGSGGVVVDTLGLSFPDPIAGTPWVIKDAGLYKMWYSALGASGRLEVRYAISPNGVSWEPQGTVVAGMAQSWDSEGVGSPSVSMDGGLFRLWYTGVGRDLRPGIGYATSTDGITWTKHPRNPVLVGLGGTFEDTGVLHPSVLWDPELGLWRMWYTGRSETGGLSVGTLKIGYATSPDGIMWTKHAANPVMETGPQGSWDSRGAGIASVRKTGSQQWEMYYTGYSAIAGSLVARVGCATSSNGVSWENRALMWHVGPIGSWDGSSVGSPFVLRDGEKLLLWYGGVGTNLGVGIGLAVNYLTIRAALVDASPAGDTILVHPGTDTAQLVVDKSVAIKSADGPVQTIIDAERQRSVSVNGSYPAVWIKSDNVALQGFTIKGAAPTEGYSLGTDSRFAGAGILVTAHGAGLRGNRVQENQAGIVLAATTPGGVSSNNIVAGNAIERNSLLGIVAYMKDSTVGGPSQADDGNTVANNVYGIVLYGVSSGNTVTNNNVRDNSGPAGDLGFGLGIYGGRDNRLVGNELRGNAVGVVLNSATGNTVESNLVESSLAQGVRVEESSTGNGIKDNRVTKSQKEGIYLSGPRNTISGNTVSEGLDTGIKLTGGASGNELLRNRIVLNQKHGVELDGANGNNVHDNSDISDNKGHGIAVGQAAANNVVERNTVVRSGLLGISVEGDSNVFRGNHIADNAQAGVGLADSAQGNRLEGNRIWSTGSSTPPLHQPLGLQILGSDNRVEQNVIGGHRLGVSLGASAANNVLHFNDFVGNSEGDITRSGTAPVDAIYNWFGDASGPGGAGAGRGDAVSSTVLYSPWLTRPYSDVLAAQHGYLGFDIGLPRGWQSLAVPLHLKDSTWGQITRRGAPLPNGLALNYEIAYRFNPATQLWEQMLDGDPLMPLHGIYVLMKDDDRMVLWLNDGAPTSPPARQVRGWALIGPAEPPWAPARPVGEVLITAWNLGLRVVSPPLSGQADYTFTLTTPALTDPGRTPLAAHGRAIWVYAPQEVTVTGTTTTPVSNLALPHYLLP